MHILNSSRLVPFSIVLAILKLGIYISVLLALGSGLAQIHAPQTNATEDFTVVVLPDTQNYVRYSQNPSLFDVQTQWIVDNRDNLNIVFVSHLGDIVDRVSSDMEWHRASGSMSILDGKVPYGIAPGNHDLDDGLRSGASGRADKFRQYFPVSRFDQQSWWGGYYKENDNTRNSSYQLFSAGVLNFIIIHLEWEAPDDVLNWTAGVQVNPSTRWSRIIQPARMAAMAGCAITHSDHQRIRFTHTRILPLWISLRRMQIASLFWITI